MDGLGNYIQDVLRDYGHKRARNKRIGPGGGTRRLHQTSFIWGSWGRNRIDERLKVLALSRRGATVSARKVQLQMTIVLRLLWLRKQSDDRNLSPFA